MREREREEKDERSAGTAASALCVCADVWRAEEIVCGSLVDCNESSTAKGLVEETESSFFFFFFFFSTSFDWDRGEEGEGSITSTDSEGFDDFTKAFLIIDELRESLEKIR
jgi:hypothetical protein